MTNGLYNEHLIHQAYDAARTGRVAWGVGGDSGTIFSGSTGYVQALEKAFFDDASSGVWGYELTGARGIASWASTRNGHSSISPGLPDNDADAQPEFRMEDANWVGGGGKHIYLAPGDALAASSTRAQNQRLNTTDSNSGDSLGGVEEALSYENFLLSTSDSGGQIWTSVYDFLNRRRATTGAFEIVPGVSGRTGIVSLVEYPMAALPGYDFDMLGTVAVRNNVSLKGPVNIAYSGWRRIDIEKGVRICPLYAQGGLPTRSAVAGFMATDPRAIGAWIEAATWGLDPSQPFVFQNFHIQNDINDEEPSWNPSTLAIDSPAIGRTSEGHANNVEGLLHYLRIGMVAARKDPDSLILIDGPTQSQASSRTVTWDGQVRPFNEAISLAYSAVGSRSNPQTAVIDGSVWVPSAATSQGDDTLIFGPGTPDGNDDNLVHLTKPGYEKWGRQVLRSFQAAQPAPPAGSATSVRTFDAFGNPIQTFGAFG